MKKGLSFSVKNFKSGFTLIELLVVISIIAILAGFGAARYLTAEKQSRDARRQSDLNQYRLALESYANMNNLKYPNPACGNVTNLCNFNSFQTAYLAGECLQDPRTSNTSYRYCSDINGSQYAMWAKLESGDNNYYIVCSNGRSGKKTYPSGTPDITNGSCPL